MMGTLLVLEQRIMLDGAALLTGAEVVQDQVTQSQETLGTNADSEPESSSNASTEDDTLLPALLSVAAPSNPKEIIFIDASVDDWQTLLEGVDPSAEAVILDPNRDGIEQMAETLAGRTGIEAIHIVSHGDQAELLLGTARLTLESMSGQYADELAVIGRALTESADLLIYGCNFGEGEAGQEAARRLAQLTSADVAASTDLTGSASLGGDWELEYRVGVIETSTALSAEAQEDWMGLLAPPTADAGGPYTINEGENLTLDASGSSDPESDPLTYRWDLDNDSIFGETGEPTTVGPTVSWATLQSFGIDDDGVYTIGVEVDDGNGGTDTATATVTVNNLAPTLSTTGSGSVVEDVIYTLNLSATDPGDDLITSWTINWGDGSIETIAGNPSSTTHTYTEPGFTFNVLASATDEDGTFLQNELLVPRYIVDSVFRFEETTGAFLQQFAPLADGLDDPIQTIIGPDGNLYVTGENSDNVVRFDPVTGTKIDVFVAANSGGLSDPGGLAFGPDGNLYVGGFSSHEVLRFNGTTGAFIDAFVTGVTNAYGVAFGPDGNLYVSSFSGDNVLKYDGTTGASLGTFVTPNAGGLDRPERMLFGPDGHLYIASSGSDEVLRYNGTTGAFIDAFVTANLGGLDSPGGIAFGPDGDLYVGSQTNDNVLRYDGTTGAFLGEYVSAATGLDRPAMFTFLPEHQVSVTAANTAPVLTSATPTLTTITEDATGNSGDLISAIVGSSITDVDSGAIEGIAITSLVSSNGTWEYDTGGGWTAVGAVTNTSALLLRSTDSLRFVPDGQNADSASVTYRAWDQTSGSAGTKVDVSTNGGTTAFSTATDTAAITVTAVNDAPVLDNAGAMTLTNVAEDDTNPPGDTVANIISSAGGDRITDVDTSALEGLAVIGVDDTNGTWQYDAGSGWTAFGAVTNTNAVLLNPNASIRFVPNSNYTGSAGNLTVRAWDQTTGSNGQTGVDVSTNGGTTPYSTATETATLTVTAMNDVPIITNLAADNLAYTGSSGALVIEQGGDATVTDVDSTDFDTGNLTVAIVAGGDNTEDVLAIRNQGTGAGQIGVSGSDVTYQGTIIGTFAGGTGGSNFVVTFNGNATPTAVTALVQNITYENTDLVSPTAGTRTVRFTVNDGDGGTSANTDATVNVNTGNAAPTITNLNADTLAYTEGDGAAVIEQNGDAAVSDVDSADLDTGNLTASIATGGDNTEDVLAIRNQGTGAGQIGVSGSDVTYQGTIIGTVAGGTGGTNLVVTFNANATPTAVTALVQNITYENTDTNSPTTSTRTVDFTINDGDGATSIVHSASVTLALENDAPVLTPATPSLTSITEDATANSGDLISAIVGSSITDVDTGALEGIAITSIVSSNGTWEYDTGSGWTAVGAVTNTSALLLRATNSLRFVPDGQNADSASVTYRAWDQTSGSSGTKVDVSTNGGTTAFSTATDTASITVTAANDAPVLDNAGTMTLTNVVEDDTDPSGDTVAAIIASASGDRITDVDTGAVEGLAVIGVDDTDGTWQYDAGSGWTAFGAVTNTNAVLLDSTSSIRFVPTANYTGSAGNLTFRAWDTTTGTDGQTGVDVSTNGGTTAYSTATEIATLTVTAVNDAPLLDNSATMTLTNIDEDDTTSTGDTVAAIVLSGGGDRITDMDTGAVEGLAVIGVDDTNGTWQYNAGSGWTAFGAVTNTNAVLLDSTSSIRFVPNASYTGTAGNITFRAWDITTGADGDTGVDVSTNGGTTAYSTATETASLTVTEVNDAPVITSDGGGATAAVNVLEDQTSVTTVTATDVDLPADTLTYSIVGGLDAALLSIDVSTGVLTFRTAPDFDTPTDADTNNVYDVIVQVSDGTTSDTQAIAITVTAGSPPPPILPDDPTEPSEPAEGDETEPQEAESQEPAEDEGGDEGTGDDVVETPSESVAEASPLGPASLGTSPTGEAEADSGTESASGDDESSEDVTGVDENIVNDMTTGDFSLQGDASFIQETPVMNNPTVEQAALASEMESLLTAPDFVNDLDRVRDAFDEVTVTEKLNVASTIAASTGLSIGYVVWLIRGGVLLSTMLSALPAWQFVDPVMVLNSTGTKPPKAGGGGVDDDSLEAMFDGEPGSANSTDATTNVKPKAHRISWPWRT